MEQQKMINILQSDMVKAITPNPTDIVVWTFNRYSMTCQERANIFQSIKEVFPNNKIIAIPDESSIKTCNQAELEQIADNIQKILKSM